MLGLISVSSTLESVVAVAIFKIYEKGACLSTYEAPNSEGVHEVIS